MNPRRCQTENDSSVKDFLPSSGNPAGVTNVTVNTTNAEVYLDGTFAATNFTPANGT